MIAQIDGGNNHYIIDEHGNVYRKLTPNRSKQGYLRIGIRRNSKRQWYSIHRLVAMAFLPNPDNKPFVNHIDGNKTNNDVTNLEWCDQSENMSHAFRTGLKKPSHPKAVRQYTTNGEFVKKYPSREEAARAIGACGSNINLAIKKHTVCAGFLWKNGGDDEV